MEPPPDTQATHTPVDAGIATQSAVPASEWALVGIWNVGSRRGASVDSAHSAPPPPKQSGAVRFVCLSDTHSWHAKHEVPEGDVFLHAGDFTRNGEQEDIASFAAWLKALPHRHKVVIAGNHDLPMDLSNFGRHFAHERLLKEALDAEHATFAAVGATKDATWAKRRQKELIAELPKRSIDLLRGSCHYLTDEGITVEGVRIFGTPWVPGAKSWAFALARGSDELREKRARIEAHATVLITHSPPAGLVVPAHKTPLTTEALPDPGCELLRDRCAVVRPVVTLCGHIHEHYGVYKQPDGSVVINAAAVDSRKAVVFDLCRKSLTP